MTYATLHEVRRCPKTGRQQQRFLVNGKWTEWEDVSPGNPRPRTWWPD